MAASAAAALPTHHHHRVSMTVVSSKLNGWKPPPVVISTNPSHVDLLQLTDLFISANHSCHRFPNLDPTTGRFEPVDANKLRIALSHSSLVVSVFEFPFSSSSRRLVGFGRAVSDNGLTASIHDVVVLPSLQGLGVGKRIVNRIVRLLTNRGIYDISALCSHNERLFFDACGFGDDILASTTMIYTKEPSSSSTCSSGGDEIVGVSAGRKLLLVPPLLKKRPPPPPSASPNLR